MTLDRDLQSIQEVRCMVAQAKQAQKKLAQMSQQQIDKICFEIAKDCAANAEKLAKMAVEETGFGVWQDKVLKNLLGSTITYENCKDMKTVGIICEDEEKGLIEVGVPMGVVAALIPSTNPTSTTMYKSIISIIAGNAIVLSPHPNAKNCILETVKIICSAAKRAGAPDGIVQCISLTTMEATDALLKHRDIGVILATGGEAMVRAAYSSGNPAIGVGPGNGPAYIEKTADIPLAVRRIMDSKTFDNGTICASEQSVITERAIKSKVIDEMKNQGCYFLNEGESNKLAGFILRSNGTMNPKIVGKSAQTIADMAGIHIPQGTRVLVSEQTDVSKKNPFAREKLCPILAFFTADDWEQACQISMDILFNEGVGHTMTIHTQNKDVVREFALKKPVSRLLVNTAAALGGVGATTNLNPALTLGCGSVGGSATSDNVSPLNLMNIRRVAYGVKELSDLRNGDASDVKRFENPVSVKTQSQHKTVNEPMYISANGSSYNFRKNQKSDTSPDVKQSEKTGVVSDTIEGFSKEDIEKITRAVINRLERD